MAWLRGGAFSTFICTFVAGNCGGRVGELLRAKARSDPSLDFRKITEAVPPISPINS